MKNIEPIHIEQLISKKDEKGNIICPNKKKFIFKKKKKKKKNKKKRGGFYHRRPFYIDKVCYQVSQV